MDKSSSKSFCYKIIYYDSHAMTQGKKDVRGTCPKDYLKYKFF